MLDIVLIIMKINVLAKLISCQFICMLDIRGMLVLFGANFTDICKHYIITFFFINPIYSKVVALLF